MKLRGFGAGGGVRVRELELIAMLACVLMACGCATRKPGADYPWVPVIESSGSDGNVTTYMGIGRKF